MRVITMNVLCVVFLSGMALGVTASLLGDRATYRPGILRRSWRTFRHSPVMSRTLWRQLREYNRPGFHPNDRDTNALVDRWRTVLFGDDGTLLDKLASTTG